MAKKKIEELTPKDFPTLDITEESFNEWLQVRSTMMRNLKIFGGIILIALVLMLTITGDIYLPGVLVPLIISIIIQSKYNKLTKKLGLSRKLIQEARRV